MAAMWGNISYWKETFNCKQVIGDGLLYMSCCVLCASWFNCCLRQTGTRVNLMMRTKVKQYSS